MTTYNYFPHGNDDGIIFSIQTNGNGFTNMFDFNDTDGANPQGSLIISGNTLYGMTYSGGLNNDGNIFSIQTNGTGFTDLFDFDGTNGANSEGSLTLSGNTLYGMTSKGGANNYGVIFKIDTNTATGVNSITSILGSVSLYPNPNNGVFTLAFSHPELVSGTQTIEIYNVLGAKVCSRSAQADDNVINLSSQSNGIYLYRVISENGELLGEGKIIVQK